MLDLAYVRENLPLIAEKMRQRQMDPDAVLRDFAALDEKRRSFITKVETQYAERKKRAEETARLKKAGDSRWQNIPKVDTEELDNDGKKKKSLREDIADLEKEAAEFDIKLKQLMTGIPNLPHESVPVGKSADDNVETRVWGVPPKFEFKPKPH